MARAKRFGRGGATPLKERSGTVLAAAILVVALVLALLVVVPLASINLFGVEGVVRYLGEISLLLIWAVSIILGMSMAARQIPRELEARTVYPLLAKPIRRSDLVLGKFLGAGLATTAAVLLFYLFFVLLCLSKGLVLGPALAQAILLHIGFCFLLSALTVLGSTVFTPSANLTCVSVVSLGVLLFGDRLLDLATRSEAAGAWFLRIVNLIGPHFEFFDLRLRVLHAWGPAPWSAVALALLYAAAYSTVLLVLACWRFNRRAL